jgi:HTH-type transcriptional regulator/antitoxin HigA
MRNPSHLTHPEKHYRKMVERADLLSDVIGSSKKHPLLNLFELTSELIRAYDLEHFDVPDTKPWELLSFLMEEHGLKQSDLPELGN